MKWYYSNRKEPEGPIAEDILVHLILTGKLAEDTLIWREGQESWQPAFRLLPALADPTQLPDYLLSDPEQHAGAPPPVPERDRRPEPPAVYTEDNRQAGREILIGLVISVAVVWGFMMLWAWFSK